METLLKLVVLTVACLAAVVPLLGVVSTSLSDKEHLDSAGGFVLWPGGASLDAYKTVLSGGVVTRALLVSVGVTVVGTLLSLALPRCWPTPSAGPAASAPALHCSSCCSACCSRPG